MDAVIGFAIESLVAVLLGATIFYCAVLDRRLKRLRSDEVSMRDTVVELVAATQAAERAIAALRVTVSESEETLADRLGRAETLSSQMAGQLGEGEEVIGRIMKIAKAARDHAGRLAPQEDAGAVAVAQDAARLEALREAEARAVAARLAAEALPVSRSAAAAAAAELFSNRIRALSLGSAA